MAKRILMKHPGTGLVKNGFYGFSWTMLLFGGFVPLFRGDLLAGVLVLILYIITLGWGTLIYSFFYNKQYTTRLIEKGYVFADSEAANAKARAKLGVGLVGS